MNHRENSPIHKRGLLAALLAAAALLVAALGAAPAGAEFGFSQFDVQYSAEDSTPGNPLDDPMQTQVGSHPFAVTVLSHLNWTPGGGFGGRPDEKLNNAIVENIPGLTGDATAIPRCATALFAQVDAAGSSPCPIDTVLGVTAIPFGFPPPGFYANNPLFNLKAPPGAVARFGFRVGGVPQIIDVRVKPGGEYNVVAATEHVPQAISIFGGVIQIWGVPADPAHDSLRGIECLGDGTNVSFGEINFFGFFGDTGKECPAGTPPRPFLSSPTACTGPAKTHWEADSWVQPGRWIEGDVFTHDNAEPPNPQGFTGCGKLGFEPAIESKPTSDSAETGTGLDFNLDFNDEGFTNPEGLLQSQVQKAEVTLPEGMTINPSIGEGLGVCTPADLDRETLDSKPGEGCPNSSKVGSLHLETPAIDEDIDGSVYLAEQDDPTTAEPGKENPFDSLIAAYLVLRNTHLGVLVKLPMKVEPDPSNGRLVTTVDNIPQFPFSHFNFHFKEGVRSALVTPATCGTYTTEAKFYPRSDPNNPRTVLSDFQITRGKDGGACPAGGIPPFNPRFEAGSLNNNAGSFSPFDMRLQREDGEQDMTKFSSTLPPGVLGSLAGVEKCGPYAVAVAKEKTGRQELADPSCPANSEIGHTLAGAGVGSALTYVPGKIYLSGPYNGDPLSVIAITPAIAGPFDAGTVAVRLALTLNPRTAEVEVDGANSDPIPHILKGIVLKLRDLRVNVDRPNFTLNPTSCDESSAKATLFGSYQDVFNPADDVPVDLSTRYQAANCLNLGFKPKLGLKLKGGTKRGGHPGLRAHYRPNEGDANIDGLVVRLPRSAFLDQSHIRTICTRVQFAADNCPKAAQYGYIRAWTPLLDEPLQGPVWLRSSNHKLPDMVFDLHGLVDVEVATRIDSVRGGIRATVEDAPDAPLSRVILNMQGGKKGLIVNSRNLCARKARANVLATAQSGKQFKTNPLMQVRCGAKRSHASHVRARVARSSQVG